MVGYCRSVIQFGACLSAFAVFAGLCWVKNPACHSSVKVQSDNTDQRVSEQIIQGWSASTGVYSGLRLADVDFIQTCKGRGGNKAPHLQVIDGGGAAFLSWTPVSEGSTYDVWRGTAEKGVWVDTLQWKLLFRGVPTNSQFDTSVQSGKVYYYAVSVHGAPSCYSDTVRFQAP